MKLNLQITSLELLEKILGKEDTVSLELKNNIIQEFTNKHLKGIANETMFKHTQSAIIKDIENNYFNFLSNDWAKNNASFKPDVAVEMRARIRNIVEQEVTSVMSEISKTYLENINTKINIFLSSIDLESKFDKYFEAKLKEKLKL